MTTAHELKEELKASLIDGAPHRATGWEWAQAVDRVVEAAQVESGGPHNKGDMLPHVWRALADVFGIGHVSTSDAGAFINAASMNGVVVLGKGDYDALVKRGRDVSDDVALGCAADAAYCARSNPFANHVDFQRFKQELADRGVVVVFASPASRAEGRKGSE